LAEILLRKQAIIRCYIFNLTWLMLLHYLVKLKTQKLYLFT